MNDATSERRTCDVCGGPLRVDNITGVCTSTPECSKERSRRDPRKTPGPKAAQCYCKICGKPIMRSNTTGICTDKSSRECRRAREALERRAKGVPEKKRNECERPGCWRTKKRGGVCGMHWSRFQRTGSYGPDEEIQIDLIEVHAEEVYGTWTVLDGGCGAVNKVPCRCACGTERAVQISALTTGRSLSCGRRCEARRVANPYLLPGTYGQVEVLEIALRSADDVRIHCNRCGRDTTKQAFLIGQGISRTCGCGQGRWTHGLSRHPLWSTWDGIRDRCNKPTAAGYENYGACGIKLCAGWTGAPDGFLSFVADMGERPDGMTVDRRDPEGGYWCGHCEECASLGRPANCRWATKETQSRNKRKVGKLAQQRNAALAEAQRALAEVKRLNSLLASPPRKRSDPAPDAAQDVLF